MKTVLGFDTSNYTTSAAVFRADGTGCNEGRLLDVPEGGLGLRQSDALFQHVRRLPERVDALLGAGELPALSELAAVGASIAPRAVEGSYMPCFLAGTSQARVLADVLGVPFFGCSHQQGCRQLERRSPRASGRALPVLAPVRRHDGAPAHRAGGRNAPYDHFGGDGGHLGRSAH